ncbi:hypothetical protein OSTOST_20884 [Ostertagia ostertagi]
MQIAIVDCFEVISNRSKMDLCVMPRLMNRVVYDAMRDFDRFEKHFPIVDDDKKFAVSLDVSQFRPEELNVHVEGRELTIEGKQEHKTEKGGIQIVVSLTSAHGCFRSFIGWSATGGHAAYHAAGRPGPPKVALPKRTYECP